MEGESTQGSINVRDVIDNAPFGVYQGIVVALAVMVIMLDGYDILVLSFTAPALAKAIGRDVASFGPLFGAGFFALLVGSLIVSPFGDWWGRKGLLLVSMAVFTLFTFMPIVDPQYSHILAYRFLGGLGLAGVVPAAAAIVTEYAPKKYRGLVVNTMYSGFGLGAVLGGLAASRLIPVHGWEAGFWLGTLLPLVMLPIIALAMPESVEYLVVTGKKTARVASILRRVDPRLSLTGSETFTMPPSPEKTGSIRDLFTAGRGYGTVLLWVILFCALLDSSLIASWINAILNRAGMPADKALLSPVAQQLGGVLGTILIGLLLDRLGARLIAITFVFAAISIAVTGYVVGDVGLALAVVFVGGFFLVGSQFSTQSLATVFYPVKIRSTGLGWALGIGRAGTVVGPLWAGAMLTAQWRVEDMFLVISIPPAIAIVAAWLLSNRYPALARTRATGAAAAQPA
jgi:AAHS family 4-hydroxybenzoate transporter-like MFS transporter